MYANYKNTKTSVDNTTKPEFCGGGVTQDITDRGRYDTEVETPQKCFQSY